jgi:hypothetical protein
LYFIAVQLHLSIDIFNLLFEFSAYSINNRLKSEAKTVDAFFKKGEVRTPLPLLLAYKIKNA